MLRGNRIPNLLVRLKALFLKHSVVVKEISAAAESRCLQLKIWKLFAWRLGHLNRATRKNSKTFPIATQDILSQQLSQLTESESYSTFVSFVLCLLDKWYRYTYLKKRLSKTRKSMNVNIVLYEFATLICTIELNALAWCSELMHAGAVFSCMFCFCSLVI